MTDYLDRTAGSPRTSSTSQLEHRARRHPHRRLGLACRPHPENRTQPLDHPRPAGRADRVGTRRRRQRHQQVSPGRPSSVAHARPAGAVALAIELEVDYTAVATVGLGGHIFNKVHVNNPHHEAAPRDDRRHAQGPHGTSAGGAAIGQHGDRCRRGRRRSGAPLGRIPQRFAEPGMGDAPLGEMIAESLGVAHVRVSNEADVSVLAESQRARTATTAT